MAVSYMTWPLQRARNQLHDTSPAECFHTSAQVLFDQSHNCTRIHSPFYFKSQTSIRVGGQREGSGQFRALAEGVCGIEEVLAQRILGSHETT